MIAKKWQTVNISWKSLYKIRFFYVKSQANFDFLKNYDIILRHEIVTFSFSNAVFFYSFRGDLLCFEFRF